MVEPSLAEQEKCKHGVAYGLLSRLTKEQLEELGHTEC